MHLKVFTKCQMLCNAYDDMSGFSILNTRGVTTAAAALLLDPCARSPAVALQEPLPDLLGSRAGGDGSRADGDGSRD